MFITGGAGFIGSHVADHLLAEGKHDVTIFDNLTSGTRSRVAHHAGDQRFRLIEGDLRDLESLSRAIEGAERVYHFASNPHIARAMTDPSIDFWQGTYLTQNLLEAMRAHRVKEFAYASGSGIYGDCGERPVFEDHGPLLPISTYGASKLACEALIHAYTHMFGLKARVFRFANVVGGRQTHGVAYDFIRRLREDPTRLKILGDGTQSKSYIHVEDVVAGIEYFLQRDTVPYSYYNLATPDYLTVKEIASLVSEEMGLSNVVYEFSGGARGWKGDVPVVRFDLSKAQARGFQVRRNAREAMHAAIRAMMEEIQ